MHCSEMMQTAVRESDLQRELGSENQTSVAIRSERGSVSEEMSYGTMGEITHVMIGLAGTVGENMEIPYRQCQHICYLG